MQQKNSAGPPIVNFKKLRTEFLNHVSEHLHRNSFDKIRRALEVAENAHAGQTRDDDTPYILHPLRIALSLIRELDIYDEELLCAALLHDVAEDQDRFTTKDINTEFGERVGSIVRTLTKPDKTTRTREEVNEIYFKRLLQADEGCKLVKLADKLDNVRDAIHSPDPKKQKRTADEAKDFYVQELLMTLSGNSRRKKLLELFDQAIETLMNQAGSNFQLIR